VSTPVIEPVIEDPAEIGEPIALNFGPQHPATHGVLHLKVWLDGERIIRIDPVVGYLHRGKEKHAESVTYQQFFPMTDRLDYLAPMTGELGLALAIEKLIGLTPPPRAEALRTIISECMRLTAHLIYVGTNALELGMVSVFMYTFKDREDLFDVMDQWTGLRTNQEGIRIGGVAYDLDDATRYLLEKFLDRFEKNLDGYEALMAENPIFINRTKNIGTLTAERALAMGVTGPILRGSGVAYDARKANPYFFYDQVKFEVPVGSVGDCYDRFLVRMMEMKESISIMRQVLAQLPSGPYITLDPKHSLPPKGRVFESMEELIHQFKVVTDMCPPVGEALATLEAPKGELGFYIVSRGEKQPYRCRIRAPSFVHLRLLAELPIGHLLSDMVPIIASLDPVMGESDR
jgi:NADH dehydrogenase I D subunit